MLGPGGVSGAPAQAADWGGTSDPFVTVALAGEKTVKSKVPPRPRRRARMCPPAAAPPPLRATPCAQTAGLWAQVIPKTLNPVWNEVLSLRVPAAEEAAADDESRFLTCAHPGPAAPAPCRASSKSRSPAERRVQRWSHFWHTPPTAHWEKEKEKEKLLHGARRPARALSPRRGGRRSVEVFDHDPCGEL